MKNQINVLLVTQSKTLPVNFRKLLLKSGINLTVQSNIEDGIEFVSNGHDTAFIDYTSIPNNPYNILEVANLYRNESNKPELKIGAFVPDADDIGWNSTDKPIDEGYVAKGIRKFDLSSNSASIISFINDNYN